jgi:hypothetical protein
MLAVFATTVHEFLLITYSHISIVAFKMERNALEGIYGWLDMAMVTADAIPNAKAAASRM